MTRMDKAVALATLTILAALLWGAYGLWRVQ